MKPNPIGQLRHPSLERRKGSGQNWKGKRSEIYPAKKKKKERERGEAEGRRGFNAKIKYQRRTRFPGKGIVFESKSERERGIPATPLRRMRRVCRVMNFRQGGNRDVFEMSNPPFSRDLL